MVKVIKHELVGYKDNRITYTTLRLQDVPKGVVLVLPGLGYTVQAPLLHYSTGVFLNKGFEVVHIHYPYDTEFYKDFSEAELDAAMGEDSREIIDKVLSAYTYDHIYLLAKSFGTIALSNEIKRDCLKDSKAIWLTPLLTEDHVFEAMLLSGQKGIGFIGDNDRFYEENRFEELKSNPSLTMHLIPGVNHSLEHDFNVIESINVHKEIIKIIEAFIEA